MAATPAFLGPLVLSSVETQLSSPQTPFCAPVWNETKSQSRPDSLQI